MTAGGRFWQFEDGTIIQFEDWDKIELESFTKGTPSSRYIRGRGPKLHVGRRKPHLRK